MIKKQLIEALEAFGDDDHIMIGDDVVSYVPTITKICGGKVPYMVYYCNKPKGHSGRCWCSCKNLYFDAEMW